MQPRFRKAKWHTFINTQRSEAKMLQNFEATFGSPDQVVVGFGDWEQRQGLKLHLEPTKGKGMRKLLRKAGYPVALVDEHRTSCQCHHCKAEEARCEKFLWVENPRPWRREQYPRVLRHGLVKCTTCGRWWNRDANSALNMELIMRQQALGFERPTYLQRGGRGG